MASNVTRARRGYMETITQSARHSVVGQGGQDCHGNGQECHTPPVSISDRAQEVGEQRWKMYNEMSSLLYHMVWYSICQISLPAGP